MNEIAKETETGIYYKQLRYINDM